MCARVEGVVRVPMLPTAPPILISDVTETCERQANGEWLIARKQFHGLFSGGAASTVMPASELAKIKERQAAEKKAG